MSYRAQNVRILTDDLTVSFLVDEYDFGLVKITCPTPSQAQELFDMLREFETCVDIASSDASI